MAAALAVAVVAVPGGAKEKEHPDPVSLVGEVRYGAIEARTGEYAGDCAPRPGLGCVEGATIFGIPGWYNLMDPNYNKCTVTAGTLTWTGKNTAELKTTEDCSARGNLPAPPGHHKILHITTGGALKMSPGPGQMLWTQVPTLTGCSVNGTFPIYHGHFDGERLYATAHYTSICDGGTAWSMFGIGAEDGPIHVTYEFDLEVVD